MKDIIDAIEGYEEITEEDARVIIAALADRVELDEESPVLLTKPTGEPASKIHTHVSSLSTKDAWLCHLWLRDAGEVLGHIPVHLACLKETFGHTVGMSYVDRAVELSEARARAEGRERITDRPAPRPPEPEPKPPPPEDSSK